MVSPIFITSLVVMFIYLIYLMLPNEQSRNEEILAYLSSKGYHAGGLKSTSGYNGQEEISIRVDLFKETTELSRVKYYRVIGMADVNDKFSFTITKKGSSMHFPGFKEQFKEYFEFNIETPNVHHTGLVLSQPDIFPLVKKVFEQARIVRVETQQDKKTWIDIETDHNVNSAKTAIDLCIGMIDAMRRFSYLDFAFEGEMNYLCFNCDMSISFEGDYCHYCGVLAPKCVICFDDPEPNEEVWAFQCCYSYVHEGHGQTWLRDHNECPYCKDIFPKLIKVVETKDLRNYP